MTATLKENIKIGDISLTKGVTGIVKGVSNSDKIKESMKTSSKVTDWFYIVLFPEGEFLLALSQIDLT